MHCSLNSRSVKTALSPDCWANVGISLWTRQSDSLYRRHHQFPPRAPTKKVKKELAQTGAGRTTDR
jgi:hypothetical protein